MDIKFVNIKGIEVEKLEMLNCERYGITLRTKCNGGCISAYTENSLQHAIKKAKDILKVMPKYTQITIIEERKSKPCDYHVYGFNGQCLV